jgi:hypothetical protein
LVVATTGCPDHSSQFQSVVRTAVSQRDDYCGGEVAVKKLSSFSFRIDACDKRTYYRCYSKARHEAEKLCCFEVPDEDAATAIISGIGEDVTCRPLRRDPL